MLKALKVILDIQELDMQMIRLMRLKRDRQKELLQIESIRKDLQEKVTQKENEVLELKKNIRLGEGEVQVVVEHIKKLEAQQNAVRKVEEFNALGTEVSSLERERTAKEQRLSDMTDKLAAEDDLQKSLKESLSTTSINSKTLIDEIDESVHRINTEGKGIKKQRDKLVEQADEDIFRIYERLLRNKRDRVVVPVENRSCSGCHIMLTAQDENVVRKGERLVFCEHCSRIQYWPEGSAVEGTTVAPRVRRRRTTKV